MMKLKTVGIILFVMAITFNSNAQFVNNQSVELESIQYLDIGSSELSDKILKSESGILSLPFTIGGHSTWKIESRKMFSEEYLIKRPDIKSYKITSAEDPKITGSLMVTENGIWSSVHTYQGLVSIFTRDDGKLIIESGMDNHKHDGNHCTHNNLDAELEAYLKSSGASDARIDNFSNGTERNEFSLALVCTGEYYALNGANDNIVLDKMAAAMMGINTIFEKELSVRFFPIDLDLFRNQNTDPFDPDVNENRPDEAAQGVAIAFPSGNYDIGHVFHKSVENDGWGSGGIARLAAVCDGSISNGGAVKAKGWSGSFDTDGNGFISLASHEFAHMFGATHTFNGSGGSDGGSTCTDAHSATSAYEIGSGTTIMSYNGLCNEDQNIASSGVADNYFHVHSLFQMITFINNEAFECANAIPLNNTPPTVNPNECGGEILIPKNTPFFLKGSAQDAENDVLLYCWEQYDEDGSGNPSIGQIGNQAANSTVAPLFRSFPPTTEAIRYFPDLTTLAEGASSDPFQVLANRDRNLLFQFTVRDQNTEGGGMATEELAIEVQSTGPLSIQNINSITAGESTSITWNTNNTDDLCENAKLLLSIDGGQTYPFIVADDLDYAAGSTTFLLPASFPSTSEGRLMIVCDDNDCYSFFDITNNDINISSECLAAASVVCDVEYEVFDQGDASLDLDLKHYDGSLVSSLSGTITSSSDIYSLIFWNESQSGCRETVASNRGVTKRITVDQSGMYTFVIDFEASSGSEVFSIHTASNFDISNLCASFLNSNSVSTDDSSIGWLSTSVLTAELDACEEYIILYYINATSHPQSFSMPSISGPGNLTEINTTPDPNFSSTFIAVNENGIIEVVSPTSDFTALSGGLYDLYTVNYKSGGPTPPDNADPSSWAGSQLTAVQTENCMLLSGNKKQILVEFTCRVNSIETGIQTSCDAASNTYSQEIIVSYESPPITGNLVVNGVPVAITGSPQTINLTGLISDGQPVGVSAAFTALSSCSMFIAELFTAPDNCCAIDLDLGMDRALCSDESITLDAGSDGVEYKWFKDGLLIDSETESTYEVLESGNYLVEVFNDVGCSKFDAVNIAIFETPSVSLEDDKSVCEGEIFNLPVMTAATSLQWYKDNAVLMEENDPTLLITEAGEYHIIGTNNYTLPNNQTLACSDSDTINVEYVTRPLVMLGGDLELCEGDPAVVLDAGQDGTNYTWARNGTVIPAETSDQLSVSETGEYTVIVDNGGGCETRDTTNITYYDLADVFAGQDVNVCEGSTNTINPFIDATSYEWYFGGSLFSDQSEMPIVTEGGEYILIGYNEIGCPNSDTVQVTQVMPPMPDLGDDRIGCIGSEVILGVDGIGSVIWTLNNNPISIEDTITITEPGTYGVTIIAANDCNGSDEIDVAFEEGPTLTLGDDDSYCAGEDYTITATTNGDDITWFKDGIEIIGESGFELIVTGSGAYSAIIEGTNCTVEDVVLITENSVPSVVFSQDETICDGEAAILVGPDGGDTYQWILEGIVMSDQQSLSVNEAGDYTLVVTNVFNCSALGVVTVNVSAVPSLELEPLFTICDGEEAMIMAESDGSSFQWTVNGEIVMGQTGSTIMVDSESMVEVMVTNTEGCTNMATTSVNAVDSPIVNLGDDVSLCPNESITFDAGMQDLYMWSNSTDGSSLTVSSNVTELTIENYGVTVTNNEGCTAEDEVQVTLIPILSGSIELSASGVCNGAPVELTATGGTSYTWIDNSGTLSDIDGANAIASPSESTSYQVNIGDDCGNEITESVTIDVFEAGDDLDAGEDDCVVIGQSIVLNATGGSAYQWLDDPTIDSGVNTENPTVSPSEETIYFVDITDMNGCVFRDSVSICILDDPLESFVLISIITPNGDGDNDELRFTGLEAFPENTLTIYNRWGYPVFERRGYQTAGELWTGENGGDILPADTYYYVLTFDGETYKSPITIMR